jgi:hypothetical protein
VADPHERSTIAGEPTGPFTPIFDTGGFPSPSDPLTAWAEAEPAYQPRHAAEAPVLLEDREFEPVAAPPQPVVLPSTYQYLKRWTFVLVVVGVWMVAAAIGPALYYWWFHSVDKTPSVFVVLVYLAICAVGSLLVAMVQNKPLLSALSIAVMSAPLASTAAAAVLYGAYVFNWIER